jgi:hypothetical protein
LPAKANDRLGILPKWDAIEQVRPLVSYQFSEILAQKARKSTTKAQRAQRAQRFLWFLKSW